MNLNKKTIFQAGAAIFLLFLCIHYWEAFTGLISLVFQAALPLITGCIIAYVVNILMSFYEKHYSTKNKWLVKAARPICMIGAFLSVILVITAVILLVVPELISCIRVLLAEVPPTLNQLTTALSQTELFSENFIGDFINIDWQSLFDKIAQLLSRGLSDTVNIAANIISSVVSVTVNLLIGIIFAIYLLLGKNRLIAQSNRILKHYLRPSWNGKIHYVLAIVNDCFHRYIVGQCMEAVILGVLCAAGMMLFGFPYAAMTGAVIGVTALIPIAGAYIGGAVGFLLILTESPLKAALFLVYLVVLQQLEGNLIYPRVVGSSIGLPGLWVLAAITIGGGVCGIPGMLFGVPLAAVLYQLLKNDLNRQNKII